MRRGLRVTRRCANGSAAKTRRRCRGRGVRGPGVPGNEITIDQIQGAIAANNAVNGRGAKLSSKWEALGPDTLDVDRLGTQSFIKPTQWSGRVTALAIDPKCKPQECTLYVGAAGGGVWRSEERARSEARVEADLGRDSDERDRLDRRRPERPDRQDDLRRDRRGEQQR